MDAASRAVHALAIGLMLACAACHRDFDALLVGDGTPAASGSGGTSGGTSGTSGTGGSCACPSCKGSTCSFDCPKSCKSCTCDRYTCPSDGPCKVECGPGTSCEVTCPLKVDCTVNCAEGASCACTGDACSIVCEGGDKRACGDGRVVCNRDCSR